MLELGRDRFGMIPARKSAAGSKSRRLLSLDKAYMTVTGNDR